MAMPTLLVELIKRTFHLLIPIAKTTGFPVMGKIAEKALFDGDDMTYLPRDAVIKVDREVEGIEEIVLPSRIVHHFIDQARCHWIMDKCICRDASHCKDYPIDLGCLFLGSAASRINPKLGRPVTREEAHRHAEKCREAGLVNVIGRNKLDTVWLGIGPKERLLTICSCCPCCCLWRAIPHLAPEISSKVTRLPGVRLEVGGECIGCGDCIDSCFVEAISLKDGKAHISEQCRGCGRCVEACPNSAIELIIEDDAFVDGRIQRISELVDLS